MPILPIIDAITLSGIIAALYSVITTSKTFIYGLFYSYNYYALFVLMTLEYASIPIPSEVVLPIAGMLSAKGLFNIYLALLTVILSGLLGIAIDYYIAYFLGREVVYKHLRLFHIKKENLMAFEEWFDRNGSFAVFAGRLVPLVRGLISFPAGFASMNKKKFFLYSFLGSIIWDAILLYFGYTALSSSNIYVTMLAIAAFVIVIYAIYVLMLRGIKKKKR